MSSNINPRAWCGRYGWIFVLFAVWAGTAFETTAEVPAPNAIPDFCFLQISDIHLDPHPFGGAAPGPAARSVSEIAWFCTEAARAQQLEPSGDTTPIPSFTVITGDLTEYGVIHKTWDDFNRLFEPLAMPFFVIPGNHDNTWTGMAHIMRARHGGDHYSFDRFGCHFVGFNTATPQEPVPTIGQRTLTWIENDLANVSADTPVFLFCHHPLSSGEFSQPYEPLRLLEAIQGHHVVLLLMGHGHAVRHERWGTLDSVMGGETWRANVGYNIISVQDGVLRVVYRYRDPARGQQLLVEKPLQRSPVPHLCITVAGDRASHQNGIPVVARPVFLISATVTEDLPKRIVASLDNAAERAIELVPATTPQHKARAGIQGTFDGQITVDDLVPGAHGILVNADFHTGRIERATTVLYAPTDTSMIATRVVLPTDYKAQPLLLPGGPIVATTDGRMVRIGQDPNNMDSKALADLGVEILHAPAAMNNTLYVSAAERGVWAIGTDGAEQWQCDLNAVVYGTPVVTQDRVYVGDMEGYVHAIDRGDGTRIWSKRHATFSIEQPLCQHDGCLYFGAWDGFVYAVDAHDGSLRWKRPGPAAFRKEAKYKSRYYGPGDCAPIVIGDRVFVVDRAYVLGSYSLAGEYLGELADGIAAIGAATNRTHFYTRGLAKGLACYDRQGRRVWSNRIPTGRFPIPPVEAGGVVYACSNQGLLTAADAADGTILWRYQVTPQLPVLAPVAADADGNVYVAGMDGSVTWLYPKKERPSMQ